MRNLKDLQEEFIEQVKGNIPLTSHNQAGIKLVIGCTRDGCSTSLYSIVSRANKEKRIKELQKQLYRFIKKN